MNEQQVKAVNDTVSFLVSSDFRFANNVEALLHECDKYLKELADAKVDIKIYNHIYSIMNQHINSYIGI
jgi:chromosome condensin MukBEF complex kleisin-like MukF subunit